MTSVHPSITAPHGVSFTLMIRTRARRMAARAARQIGMPVDSAGLERAAVGVYRNTGSPHEAARVMRAAADAIAHAMRPGGDAA